ncbi:NRAMP family divalent metal transporter [Clostridium luticellarii]|jgi:Mn2+/Fe2+ NRAMP family transporter|uniref:Divalent metal cation transporter MntH n=1 Tax=Clostridium luticellarii TaxID=1691940 RepID=A0A2T0BPJ7_9CLOT|nr:NRAMP family divalent metal transporter [Clostridium luticellarii]MCI1944195.1 divalent metal cation transporter [Clostridium luticellarii]MCI1967697.1 divalent metal cation transporter [Clostridium luticellarii]MCI1994854.1 divalent metal cation transporter [Clostridium luticellarii]MCI2039661.1 divalent metal cation transporter [Clostridium luticellarii]PRR85808.1 Divalent metal cation transporter MntH [Clostridium luticellarii]
MNQLNENSLNELNINNSKFENMTGRMENNKLKLNILMLSLIGPGVLAAMGDNDAGGIISYCITGAKFGISFFIPLTICLSILTYTVQEMSMRLGNVSRKGFVALIGKYYGNFWMKYQLYTLLIENILMLVTEFMGTTTGLVMIGVPFWLGTVISLGLMLSIMTFKGYLKREKIALFMGIINIVFIVIAFMSKPDIQSMLNTFASWNYTGYSPDMSWYIAAIVGNSVAPWMIFFQGSACIDRGAVEEHIHIGRIDTLIGCIIQVIVAVCIIISGAALFGHIGNIESAGPAMIIKAFEDNMGKIAGILFAVGIFNAGLLTSITIDLSSSWCAAEAFKWPHSLNDKINEAPKFYAVYAGSAVIAAFILLIPNLPLNYMALLTQVIGGLLIIPILIFLVVFTNKKELMGNYKNSLFVNIRACAVTALLIGAALFFIVHSFVL